MRGLFSKSIIPYFVLTATISIALFFQNCSGKKFSSNEQNELTNQASLENCEDKKCDDIIAGTASCLFNGTEIPSDKTVTAYLNSSGTSCVSETRSCSNGELSGSYTYASCTVDAPKSCLFNGVTVPSGSSVAGYLNSSAKICTSESRVCTNGVLSGSFQFSECTTKEDAACLFDGKQVASGLVVTAYKNSAVAYGAPCESELRLCNDGKLSGNYVYGSCVAGAPASCMFNGQTVVHGSTVTTYQASTVPFGQTCSSQVRACNNGSLAGSYPYASCSVQGPAACMFDGKTIVDSQTVKAFQTSSVPFNSTCVSQDRLCSNGALSGSYAHPSCNVGQPATCSFNGAAMASGQTVTAFATSTVPYGQTCSAETRLCTNGALSGSYTFGSCVPNAPIACLFNGQTIVSGGSVKSYIASTVPYGQTCAFETRVCTNGNLSGSATYASCQVDVPKSCLFDGKTIVHGDKISAYKTASVSAGSACQVEERICTNGALSGSAAFATCTPTVPVACTLNGKTIAHNATIKAYKVATVPYRDIASTDGRDPCESEDRKCENGKLSGSFTNESCTVQTASTCSLNGATINNGSSVTVFKAATVPFGSTCESEVRKCTNGVLSGTATVAACKVDPAKTCSFNGNTIAHGATARAYKAASVPFGSTCSLEERVCTNGVLSGSNTAPECLVEKAKTCTFDGKAVAHNATVTAFKAASVSFGSTCASEVRTCNNGVLSGTNTVASCTVDPAKTCSFNGSTIAHTKTVTAFKAATVPFGSTCASEVRTCTNGVLSGTNTAASCAVDPAKTCTFDGKAVAHNATVTAFKAASVSFGSTCASEVRTCNNGVLSGTNTVASCKVDPAKTCTFDGKTVAHSATVTAYKAATVPFGSACSSEVRTCTNGVLSGTFAVASCREDAAKACSFNGSTIGSGSKVTAYSTASVPYGATCSEQVRTCTNGTLSGSYTYAACKVEPSTKVCKVVFSSGATASSQQSTQALCQNYYQQLKTNNPNQTFSAVYYDGTLIMNFSKVCKVTFSSGATSATSVTSQTECRNYYNTLVKNNPNSSFSYVHFDGSLIIDNTKVCKVTFSSGATSATSVTSQTECRSYYNTLVKNNPNSNFSYVHFDGSLIIDNTKVCKVTFKSGASAATSVITKAQCQSYYSEIKKNNPNSPISKVTFDGTNIL